MIYPTSNFYYKDLNVQVEFAELYFITTYIALQLLDVLQ